MSRHPSNFTIILTLSLFGTWACQKDQPGTAPDAQSASQPQTAAPMGSTMMEPGSGDMMEPGSGDMMQRGSGNMMGSGQMMQAGSGDMMQQLRSGCPMMIDGAKIEVTDTPNGVALAFTTETGNATDIRQRVEHMAQMYEAHCSGRGQMMWHQMGGHGKRGMMGSGGGQAAGAQHGMGTGRQGGAAGGGMGRMGPMPAATAKVEPLEKGARLVLTVTDQSQLEQLRAHARRHEQRMRSGECWMLQQNEAASEQEPTE